MATAPKTTSSPVESGGSAEGWDYSKLPKADEEFDFTDINSMPAWCDKGWASYNQGPALALPNDLTGQGPYTTITARKGDKVVFTAAKGSKAASFSVVQKDNSGDPGQGTYKPVAVSNASLEDLVKTENLTPDQLSDDAKGQMIVRNPAFAKTMGIDKTTT